MLHLARVVRTCFVCTPGAHGGEHGFVVADQATVRHLESGCHTKNYIVLGSGIITSWCAAASCHIA